MLTPEQINELELKQKHEDKLIRINELKRQNERIKAILVLLDQCENFDFYSNNLLKGKISDIKRDLKLEQFRVNQECIKLNEV